MEKQLISLTNFQKICNTLVFSYTKPNSIEDELLLTESLKKFEIEYPNYFVEVAEKEGKWFSNTAYKADVEDFKSFMVNQLKNYPEAILLIELYASDTQKYRHEVLLKEFQKNTESSGLKLK